MKKFFTLIMFLPVFLFSKEFEVEFTTTKDVLVSEGFWEKKEIYDDTLVPPGYVLLEYWVDFPVYKKVTEHHTRIVSIPVESLEDAGSYVQDVIDNMDDPNDGLTMKVSAVRESNIPAENALSSGSQAASSSEKALIGSETETGAVDYEASGDEKTDDTKAGNREVDSNTKDAEDLTLDANKRSREGNGYLNDAFFYDENADAAKKEAEELQKGKITETEEKVEQAEKAYEQEANDSLAELQYMISGIVDEALENQADNINEPANIATGANEFSVWDFSFSSFFNEVYIKRDYVSDNSQSNSFGRGWNFNYDSGIIYGVKKEAFEQAEQISKYRNEAEMNFSSLFNERDGYYIQALAKAEEARALAQLSAGNALNARDSFLSELETYKNIYEISQSSCYYRDPVTGLTPLESVKLAVTETEKALEKALEAEGYAFSALENALKARELYAVDKLTLENALKLTGRPLEREEREADYLKEIEGSVRYKLLITLKELKKAEIEINKAENEVKSLENKKETKNLQEVKEARAAVNSARHKLREQKNVIGNKLTECDKTWSEALEKLAVVSANWHKSDALCNEETGVLTLKYREVSEYRERLELKLKSLFLLKTETEESQKRAAELFSSTSEQYKENYQTPDEHSNKETLFQTVNGRYFYAEMMLAEAVKKLSEREAELTKLTQKAEEKKLRFQELLSYYEKEELRHSREEKHALSNETRNTHTINSSHEQFFSNTRIKYINEAGEAILWQIMAEPDYTSTKLLSNGSVNYYPDGSPLKKVSFQDDEKILSEYGSSGESLYLNPEGTLTVTKKDRSKTTYSDTGRLQTVEDRSGNRLNFSYEGRDLKSITDNAGRKTLFESENNRIVKITDPLDQVYSYSYTGEFLTSFTNPEGHVYTYTYDQDVMTEKTTPDGGKTLFEYTATPEGKMLFTRGWDSMGFVWDTEFDFENRYAVEINRDRTETTYFYDDNKRTTEIRYSDGTSEYKVYDKYGNLIKETDRAGYITEYSYDENRNRTAMILPDSSLLAWSYNEKNQVTSFTGPLGYITSFEYDTAGNLIRKIHPDNTEESFSYNSKGLLTGYTDPNGNRTSREYDLYGYVSKITHPDGFYIQRENDSLGQILKHIDERGYTTEFTYNKTGEILTITTDKGVIKREYNKRGEAVKVTDPLNNVYHYEYTLKRVLKKEISPLGYETEYSYTGEGELKETLLPDGSLLAYGYDSDRNRTSLIHKDIKTSLEYDSRSNLISRTDGEGNRWEYKYDALSRLISVKNPEGNTSQREYDKAGNLIKTTDFRGNKTEYFYDTRSRLISVINPLGHKTEFYYDRNGNRTAVINPEGHKTEYEYDKRNRLTALINPEGYKRTYEYDPSSNIIKTADFMGNTTCYEYDSTGMLIAEINALGHKKAFGYDANNNLISVTDEEGYKTEYTYDAQNRLTIKKDPEGNTTHYYYDPRDRVIKITNGLNESTTYEYDSPGNLKAVINPLGERTEYTYSKTGQKLSGTNPLGVRTEYEYSSTGKLISVTDPMGTKVSYEYDEEGNLTAEINGAGYKHLYEYNELSQRVAEINRLGDKKQYFYNPSGKLSGLLDFEGIKKDFFYSPTGRLLEERVKGVSSKSFNYDAKGKMIMAKSPASQLSFHYDTLGRLTETHDSLTGNIIKNSYDKRDNRTAIYLNNELSAAYSYNSLGKVTKVTALETETFFTYDALGRESRRQTGRDISVKKYDSAGRMLSIQHKKGNQTVRADSYLYDPAGRKEFKIDERGHITKYDYYPNGMLENVTYTYSEKLKKLTEEEFSALDVTPSRVKNSQQTRWNFTHQDQSRLKEAFYNIAPSWTWLNFNKKTFTESYTYTPGGNRESKNTPLGTVSYTYDPADRLLKAGNKLYEYSKNGNLMKESVKNDIITYLYNSDNRMIQYKNDSSTINYTYDAHGRRNSRYETSAGWKKQNDTLSRYTYDGFSFNNLREERTFINKWNDVQTLDHHYLGMQVLGTREIRWYNSHNLTYKHDSLGSVIGVDEYNSVRPVYYTAFGKGYNQWNDKENYFGYNGKPEDPVTGLYNYGYRDYAPMQGRFTSVDPIKDGNNWYVYCGNDSVNFVDVLGLKSELDEEVKAFMPDVETSAGYSTYTTYHDDFIFDENADEQFIADVKTSLSYAEETGADEVFKELHESGRKVRITEFDGAFNAKYRDTEDYIQIDTREGYIISSGPNKGEIRSPLGILIHETDHYNKFHKNPVGYMKRGTAIYPTGHPFREYDNVLEYHTIRGIENKAAGILGEGLRYDHRGIPIPVTSPISTTPKSKSEYYKKITKMNKQEDK